MRETGTIIAFFVVVVAALAILSYLLWRGAGEYGHPRRRVISRLGVVWGCVGLAVALGLLVRRVFRGPLFEFNLHREYATPWFQLTGPSAGLVLLLSLGIMVVCAVVAIRAADSLQHPAEPDAEEASSP